MSNKTAGIGAPLPIRDGALKVTGAARYVADMKLPHMLHGKLLLSPYPHAKIRSIDTSKALALEGVHAVVTYLDSPAVVYNGNGEDKDFYKTEKVFDQIVRFAGDKVAAVAAETPAIAAKAVKLIEVDYVQLPFYLEAKEAMAEGAYAIHPNGNVIEEVNLSCGDVEAAFQSAYRVYEDTYRLPAVHHGAMEPHVSIAQYEADGKLTIYTPTQDVFGQRENLHRIFGLPMNKIRVVSSMIGGAFGGKIDLITEPITALLAMKTGRPVKLELSRREDIVFSRCRHAMDVTIKTGVDNRGNIVAQDVIAIMNAGAQTSATMSVCWAMGGKLFKSYKTPNLRYRGVPVYTNTIVASAMRGFGSPQLNVPQQCQMARIAQDLGISLIDFQLQNLVDPYDTDLSNGEALGNAQVKACVEKGAAMFDWEGKLQQIQADDSPRYKVGVGMATAVHGNGIYGVMPDYSGMMLKLNEDGSATLFTGVCDMGNGAITVQTQVIEQVLGIPRDKITCVQSDTETTLWDLGVYASRSTFVGAHAVKKVAEQLRLSLAKEAAELLGVEMDTLLFADETVFSQDNPCKKATLQEVMTHAHQTHEQGLSAIATFANCSTAMSYGAHFARVVVDIQTDEIQVTDYVAIHDAGFALNPLAVEGQMEGGIQMGLGYGLCEEIRYDQQGRVATNTFKAYPLFNATQMPKIQVGLVESFEQAGPFGAKSIGECATAPVASAVVNAVAQALGKPITQLPLTKEGYRVGKP